MSERVTRRLLVSGRVQGVGYRESMREVAETLGVTGWVRNRVDGRVEAVVCGTHQAVAAMIGWARRGPPSARVEDVEEHPAEADCAGFERRPTA